MKLRLLALVVLFATVIHHAPAQEKTAWKAGLASIVITPEKNMWMSGYGGRDKVSEGKVHDLFAKAVAIEDGSKNRCLLITLDLVGIDQPTSNAIRQKLAKSLGLANDAISLACSHTHCGPVVGTNLRTMYFLNDENNKLIDEYTTKLIDKVALVGENAFKNLMPAELSWGEGKATFAVNRRTNKEADVVKLKAENKILGPSDHAVPVLLIKDASGKTKGIVFGYACHSTTLSFFQWCGDYPGFAMLELEKRHPGATALFWAGCGADQNPLPRRTVELAQNYGNQLADSVDAVLKQPMKTIQGTLKKTYSEIPLSFAELPTRDKLIQDSQSKDKFQAGRAKFLLKKLEAEGSIKEIYQYPIETWKLGDGPNWVFLGGEVVVDYAIKIKEALGKNTWVCAYAIDVMAYIPSLRVLKEGGYEGGGSMVYYGLPAFWAPSIEDKIMAEVKKQNDSVSK
jgi:neutral ceramidase